MPTSTSGPTPSARRWRASRFVRSIELAIRHPLAAEDERRRVRRPRRLIREELVNAGLRDRPVRVVPRAQRRGLRVRRHQIDLRDGPVRLSRARCAMTALELRREAFGCRT